MIIKEIIRLRVVITVKIRQKLAAQSAGTISRSCWVAVRVWDIC